MKDEISDIEIPDEFKNYFDDKAKYKDETL